MKCDWGGFKGDVSYDERGGVGYMHMSYDVVWLCMCGWNLRLLVICPMALSSITLLALSNTSSLLCLKVSVIRARYSNGYRCQFQTTSITSTCTKQRCYSNIVTDDNHH
jgi:hypothetical protein